MDFVGKQVFNIPSSNTNPHSANPLVRANEAVTLVGPGPTAPYDIDDIVASAPRLVAADGGAAHALQAGHNPEAVIGDLDSLPDTVRKAVPADRIHRIAEQETTDFEKCLARIDAPLILATGFTGGRLDHELAVYNALARHPHRRCIVIGSHDLVFLSPRRLELGLAPGTRLSLFPMGQVSGWSAGLEWPIEGLEFSPLGRVGTSNRVVGEVTLEFSAEAMLLILPREALPAARAGLERG